ncbi:hypothetical protein ACW0JT_19195 [Arthrobacter sp. SA17]
MAPKPEKPEHPKHPEHPEHPEHPNTPQGPLTRQFLPVLGLSAESMSFLPWWQRYPERLQWEISELQALGVVCRVDEEKRTENQTVVMALSVPGVLTGTAELKMTAVFPDYYPLVPRRSSPRTLRCRIT